ncbi:MAG: hypothetical protein KDC11_13915, partial [Chitinophagaceae bacterium]|nr:hypothetical protein [Chitinophagaceae bacterium]
MALSETWFLDGDIDFELQKYRLLAYLQQVNKYFEEYKLYPQLSDIVFHYRNLDSFRKNKELLQNSFPKKLDGADMEQLKLVYTEMLADDDVMQVLEEITGYAMQQIKGSIDHGTELYEEIERQMTFEPIGIQPLYRNEGYIMLNFGRTSDVPVYYYNVSLFTHMNMEY